MSDPEVGATQEMARTVAWIERNSRELNDLEDPVVLRALLEDLATNVNGTRASSATLTRRRSALFNALEFAVELKRLPRNPLNEIKRKRLPPAPAIDRRRVANPLQARALICAAGDQDPELEAFFATMYFAGLRPGEVLNLRSADATLPKSGWGRLLLVSSYQRAGSQWTDSQEPDEERQLKHRALEDTREVPCHPVLVKKLRTHIERYKIPPTGRLFVSRNGSRGNRLAPGDEKPVSANTIYRAWARARQQALDEREFASPLARRPYDLRHACLSTWLNAGVAPVQVAEWAGHSVAVLLSVYAKCIDGQEDIARQQIEKALDESHP
jgi:integrase